MFDVLVPEMKKLVICVFAVKHTDVTMSDDARNCVKDTTPDNSVFVFVLLSLVLLQVFYILPANQIIISIYD